MKAVPLRQQAAWALALAVVLIGLTFAVASTTIQPAPPSAAERWSPAASPTLAPLDPTPAPFPTSVAPIAPADDEEESGSNLVPIPAPGIGMPHWHRHHRHACIGRHFRVCL